jgi:signal transduction histidine kinase
VENVVEDMKGILKQGQQIQYSHQGEEEIVSDRNLMKNILINLISNAAKFSEENSTINIHTELTDGKAFLAVTDQGIGISEEDQQHLFSSFFRGKNALNIQGTGLGLHIVKRYADLLGGTLSLKSKLNKGTTITLMIPVKSDDNGKDNISN